ncbi:hypothetical protein HPB50_007462 [Hyalomma asiaticum]|uniref:Uncharacterized protein n=1 Tax=Hyalomma asiaticum TaxID=266040 RepID=A0ACB7TDM8_HYAAI|nr:hypothetical protein HPB50_007462 [Hyalomma asiaticum]
MVSEDRCYQWTSASSYILAEDATSKKALVTEELWILTFVNGVSGKVNTKELPAELQGIGKLHKEHQIQLQTGAKELLAADPFSRASSRDTEDTELEEIDKDRFAGRRNGEDSEEITSVEATWQHLQSSRKHSPRNRGPGSNGSKSTATTRATTGQHDDQTKVTPRRRGRQPRANTPKL